MDSGNSHTLLNLDPENTVFYVGGYPSDFTVSVNVISPSEYIYLLIWRNDLRSLFQLYTIYKIG